MDKDAELIRYIATLLATAQTPPPPRSSVNPALEAILRIATAPGYGMAPPSTMPELGYQAPVAKGLRQGLVAPRTSGLPFSGAGIGMPHVGQVLRRSVPGRRLSHSKSFDAFFKRINPSPSYVQTAASQYAAIKNLIEASDSPARVLSPYCYQQGSYGRDTAMYTINDLDIVVLCRALSYPGTPTGTAAASWCAFR